MSVVGLAHTVPEAIASAEEKKPGAILLDISMPGGGSGMDVMLAAKKMTPAPTIIVLTNYSSRAYREKFLAAGADYFFDKSTDFTRIINVLSNLGNSSGYNFPT